ncbi:MAG: WYL domain-containing transcriptional regulator [Phycisphaerales bacterium]
MKHSRVSRIVNILTTLQSGEKYTPDDLVKLLGISKRTVFRDLKELQSIGVPYKYDKEECCYQIGPKFFLPPIDFSLQEALSILMLLHKMRHNLPMPYKNSALLAAMKIENNLPLDIRQYCSSSLAKITVSKEQHSSAKNLDSIYQTIQQAIRRKQILQISYASLFEKGILHTLIHPYHLLYKKRAWYVIGYSEFHNSIRTFNLGRIEKLETNGKCFVDGDNFDVDEYLGRAWCLIPEGKLYDVKLQFAPLVAKNVAEVQWHSTQQAQWNEDGWVTLNFRVDGLGEISWWVLGYGDQVKVLSPAALRQKVCERAKNFLKMHENI